MNWDTKTASVIPFIQVAPGGIFRCLFSCQASKWFFSFHFNCCQSCASVNTPLPCCWESEALNQYGETSPCLDPFEASQVYGSCNFSISSSLESSSEILTQNSAQKNTHLQLNTSIVEFQTGNVSMDRSGIAPQIKGKMFPEKTGRPYWRLDQLFRPFFWISGVCVCAFLRLHQSL